MLPDMENPQEDTKHLPPLKGFWDSYQNLDQALSYNQLVCQWNLCLRQFPMMLLVDEVHKGYISGLSLVRQCLHIYWGQDSRYTCTETGVQYNVLMLVWVT